MKAFICVLALVASASAGLLGGYLQSAHGPAVVSGPSPAVVAAPGPQALAAGPAPISFQHGLHTITIQEEAHAPSAVNLHQPQLEAVQVASPPALSPTYQVHTAAQGPALPAAQSVQVLSGPTGVAAPGHFGYSVLQGPSASGRGFLSGIASAGSSFVQGISSAGLGAFPGSVSSIIQQAIAAQAPAPVAYAAAAPAVQYAHAAPEVKTIHIGAVPASIGLQSHVAAPAQVAVAGPEVKTIHIGAVPASIGLQSQVAAPAPVAVAGSIFKSLQFLPQAPAAEVKTVVQEGLPLEHHKTIIQGEHAGHDLRYLQLIK